MSKAKRVVIIDTEKSEVLESSVACLEDCQKIVGGLIERAIELENGDEMYVNEEGLHIQGLLPFVIDGEVFMGTAYIIGGPTKSGNNTDAASTIEEIRRRVVFLVKRGSIYASKGGQK